MIPVLIASATLAVGMPVTCHPAGSIAAFYQPTVAAIGVLEPYCDEVRDGTNGGSFLLAHELGHAFQAAMHLPFDEEQADALAAQWWRPLQRALGGRPPVVLEGDA